jgi:hypothetical protein
MSTVVKLVLVLVVAFGLVGILVWNFYSNFQIRP